MIRKVKIQKSLAVVLAIVIVLGMLPLTALAAWSGGEWVWEGDPAPVSEAVDSAPSSDPVDNDPANLTVEDSGGKGNWTWTGEWDDTSRHQESEAEDSAPEDDPVDNDLANQTVEDSGGKGNWVWTGEWDDTSRHQESEAEDSAPEDDPVDNDLVNLTVEDSGGKGNWVWTGEWDDTSRHKESEADDSIPEDDPVDDDLANLTVEDSGGKGNWVWTGEWDGDESKWSSGSWNWVGNTVDTWTSGSWDWVGNTVDTWISGSWDWVGNTVDMWISGSWSWVGIPKDEPPTGKPIAPPATKTAIEVGGEGGKWVYKNGTWDDDNTSPSGGGGASVPAQPAQPLFTSSKTNPEEKYVDVLYIGLLGRNPDAEGFANWVKLIEDGTMTFAQVAYAIMFSEEAKAANLTDEQFVTRLYNGLLGRNPDAGGLENWVGLLSGGVFTKEEVFNAFVTSMEFNARMTQLGLTV